MNIEEAARAWHEAGASVLPAQHGKRPVVEWKTHQETRAHPDMWDWDGVDGLGIVTGYGGFEMIEIEGSAVELITEFGNRLATAGLLAKLSTYIEATPSGGLHWIYRIEHEQEGSTKLARSATGKTMIETRGRFAWTVVAPSGGAIHDEIPGGVWSLLGNSTPGVVATLTEEEHAQLFDIAREFDLMPLPAPEEHRERLQMAPDGSLSPGQDYEARATFEELLEPLGWTHTPGRRPVGRFWTRPGKRYGLSATVTDSGNLYVFSTSCYPLESDRSYTKFGAYTALYHNGDYSAAARELASRNYGSPRDPVRILNLVPSPPADSIDGATVHDIADAPTLQVETTLTDEGNATLLAQRVAGRLVWCPERQMWLCWTGTKFEWEPGDDKIMWAMRELAREMQPMDKEQTAHKMRSLSYRGIYNASKLVVVDPAIQVSINDLDADPWSLNTPDGVVDLTTGALTPPTPEGRHTLVTSVGIDLAPPEKFLAFLRQIFSKADNPEAMIEFIQRFAGYAATGKVTHHILPFFHGSGANGKSVLMEILQIVLGSYSWTAPGDLLLVTGREDIYAQADLAGKRLVVCSEVPPTAKFHEERAKKLTGGDRISARFPYGRYFQFTPTHHLLMAGNHQPSVPSGGSEQSSFWRRMRLVPFAYTVPKEERIEGLAEKLVAEEGPRILGWIVAGAIKQFDARKLAEPREVMIATSTYAEEEDAIGRFMAERIRVGGGKFVRELAKTVFAEYERWCATEGVKSIPQSPFGRELAARGIQKDKSNGKHFYVNMSLLRSESDPDEERPEQQRF